MTPEMFLKSKRSLIQHEKKCNMPYIDTMGKITIGIGYNLSDRGLSDDWINTQFQQDVTFFYNQLCRFDWFHELNEDRQVVLIDMCFMGWKKFLEFEKMIDALSQHNYKLASDEMLNSRWAQEVKGRAFDLAQGMLTGVYTI